MTEINSYKDLNVWQKGIDLTVEVYKLIKKLPKEETYVLSDQLRRAAVSIPANIAEGKHRGGKNEYAHFLSIAIGSKAELETLLLICVKIGYLNENDISNSIKLLDEIGKMLYSLMSKLKNPSTSNQ